ncbi:MAG TPA: hypothetical protein VIL25_09715 [Vicinamibacterales bacterium]
MAASAILLYKTAVLQQGRLRAEAMVSSLVAAKERTVEAADLPLVTRASELFIGSAPGSPVDLTSQERTDVRVAVILGGASPKSEATLPTLISSLGESRDLQGEGVWVISDRPSAVAARVAAAARAAGATATELVIRSPDRFAEVTGIDAVPMLLVFSGHRLQLAAVGQLIVADAGMIRRMLQQRTPVRNPFLIDTEPDPLIKQPAPPFVP